MYYVYVYLDPRKIGDFFYGDIEFDNEPFYLGKGKNERDKVHLEKCKTSKRGSYPFYDKLNKLKKEGIKPFIVRLDFFENEDDALLEEKRLISKIGRSPNGPLLNLTDGGIGGDTFSSQSDQRKEEIRSKRSKSNKGKNKGKKCSEDQKEKLRIANTGKKASDETRKKMSLKRQGKSQSTVKCPYCLTEGGSLLMKRWHFDNCKEKGK